MPVVRVKKKCCKSSPRCKRCPVVLKRLAKAGLAERVDQRIYRVDADVRKRDYRAARK
ncbi:MAG: hypothetical protein QOH43_1337 [Solirubrobacteraceae bacterium]|nr:hypothetical protein [Solirubrobacteraceae bacterium]